MMVFEKIAILESGIKAILAQNLEDQSVCLKMRFAMNGSFLFGKVYYPTH